MLDRDGRAVAKPLYPRRRLATGDPQRRPGSGTGRQLFPALMTLILSCFFWGTPTLGAAPPQASRGGNADDLRQLRERIDHLKTAIAGTEETRA